MPKAQASAASHAQGSSLDTDESYQRYRKGDWRRGQYHRWPRLKPWTVTDGIFDIPTGEVFCRAEVRRGVLCENSKRWSQPGALRGHVKREHSRLAALPVCRRGRPSAEEISQTLETYYNLLRQIDKGSSDSDVKDEIVVKILPDPSSDDDEEEPEVQTEDDYERQQAVELPAYFAIEEENEDREQPELDDGMELNPQSESEEYHTATEEDYYIRHSKIGSNDHGERNKVLTTKERMRRRVKFTEQSESESEWESNLEEDTDDGEDEDEEEEEDNQSKIRSKDKIIPQVSTPGNVFDPPFDRNKVWIPKPNLSTLRWEPRTSSPKRALRLNKILKSLNVEIKTDVDDQVEEIKRSAPLELRKRKPSPPTVSLPKDEEKLSFRNHYKKPKLDQDRESGDCEEQKTSSSERYWLSRTGQPTPPVETEGTRQTIYASRDS